jgi:PKD repeat protein
VNNQVVNQGAFFQISGKAFQMNYSGGNFNDVVVTRNDPTAAENLNIMPNPIEEGQRVVLTGHLTDSNQEDILTLVVDWDDGTPVEYHTDLGTAPFAIPHRYQDHGVYTVHLTWFDDHGEGNNTDMTVIVQNVPPTLSDLAVTSPIHVGDTATLSGTISDPGTHESFTLTVDWADGSDPETFTYPPGTTSFSQTHPYQKAGTFSINLALDDGADITTSSIPIVVLDAAAPSGGGVGDFLSSLATDAVFHQETGGATGPVSDARSNCGPAAGVSVPSAGSPSSAMVAATGFPEREGIAMMSPPQSRNEMSGTVFAGLTAAGLDGLFASDPLFQGGAFGSANG